MARKPAPPSALRRVGVIADTSDEAPLRARWSASLCDYFGAELVGLAVAKPVKGAFAPIDYSLTRTLAADAQAAQMAADSAVHRAEAIFRRAACLPTAKWRAARHAAPLAHLGKQLSDIDLVVVGRLDGEGADPVLSLHPADLVLSAGRPVIVLPPGVSSFSPEHLVIGWQDTPESRRALRDSLPFAQAAESVTLVQISAQATSSDLALPVDFLRAHGARRVSAAVEAPGGGPVSDQLMRLARAAGATMMATGAFGRSRLREWLLGGVTRDLIESTPLPSLMSH